MAGFEVGDGMSGRYWDEQLETLPTERRRLLQDHRLRWQVRRCWDGSPFYRARLEAAGIDPATFGGLTDLSSIPILRIHDLPRSNGEGEPSPDWTVAPSDWWQERERTEDGLVRVLTDGDVTQRAHQVARALWAAGIRPGRSLPAMARETPGRQALEIANVAPYAGYFCDEGDGVHWSDDQFLIEAIDPDTSRPVEAGRPGALVVTDLAREGSPLLRFWPGLEVVLIDGPSRCGRTSLRAISVGPLR